MLIRCTENVKFFQNLGPESHEQCCRYMFHKYIKSGTILFELGQNKIIMILEKKL